MKRFARFLLFLLFILVVLAGFLFTIRNPEPVALWLGVAFAPRPLSVWLIAAFIAGGLAGLAIGAGLVHRLKLRLLLRQQRLRLEQQDRELAQLRARLATLENPGGGEG
jgi:putative membrane protein